MNTGITLNELGTSVARVANLKQDYLASGRNLNMSNDLQLGVAGYPSLDVTPLAHRQIGQKLNIPAKYYDRMRSEAPDLLADNVNRWMKSTDETRMLRTLKPEGGSFGRLRAFLSSRYRALDNEDLMNALLPIILEKGAVIHSSNLTETNLYIHARFPSVEREIKVGDVVQSGVIIQNSEVGMGSLKVQPWVYRLVCSNGMIVADRGVSRKHIGKSLVGDELTKEMMSDETKLQTDKAFWMQTKDVVRAVCDKTKFLTIVESYAEKAQIEVESPEKAVEIVDANFGLSKDEGKDVLRFLCEGGDYTQWGVANSVTRLAHDVAYDRGVELEVMGGQVMELEQSIWN